MLVLYNCAVLKVVFVVYLRIVSVSFIFSKTWSINPLKPFRTCQSISDKNDICLVIVYFVFFFVCLLFAFFNENAHTFGSRVQRPNQSPKLPPQSRSRSRSRVSRNRNDRDATKTKSYQGKHKLLTSCRLNIVLVVITKSPFHLIPEQGMLIVSVSLRSH